MKKDASYHQSAVEYNEGLAVIAEELTEKVEHPEVKKWCRSVGKQHRFHAKRHQSALLKLQKIEDSEAEDVESDILDDDELEKESA